MKRFLAIALAATVGLAFASAAQAAGTDSSYNTGTYDETTGSVAAYGVGISANGIKASRHNIGSMGSAITASPLTGGLSTSEICVYCHTPHHTISETNGVNGSTAPGTAATMTGSTGEYGPAPLWNRRSAATNFIAYGSTIGGTNQPGNTLEVGGVTLACLSCHDGITTFDNLVNAPGPGGLQTTYGDAGSAGWNFMDEGTATSATTLGGEARLNIGNGGTDINGGGLSANTANLSNDHPMSIPYNQGNLNVAGIVASLRNSDTTISSINLRAGLSTSVVELDANLKQNRWAVKGFISDTATINDLLRNGNVECSSCHDPHFKNLSNIDLNLSTVLVSAAGVRDSGGQNTIAVAGNDILKADGLFLRRVGGNAGSGVCRTCHNK